MVEVDVISAALLSVLCRDDHHCCVIFLVECFEANFRLGIHTLCNYIYYILYVLVKKPWSVLVRGGRNLWQIAAFKNLDHKSH